MSIKRWNARRDANESEITVALRACGVQVLLLDDFDLLTWFRGTLRMGDVKTAKGRTTLAQERLLQAGWPLGIWRTPEDALKAHGAIR